MFNSGDRQPVIDFTEAKCGTYTLEVYSSSSSGLPVDNLKYTDNTCTVTSTSNISNNEYPINSIITLNKSHNISYQSNDGIIKEFCTTCEETILTFTLEAPKDLVYNGSPKEATVTASKADITIPSIVYKSGDVELTSAPTEAGSYTASITYGEQTASIEFTIVKITPTADCFTFTPPAELNYDGNAKLGNVISATGIGAVTVKYYDANGAFVEAPKNAGTYTVKIDVAESDVYASGIDILIGEFTITKKAITVTAEGKTICLNGQIQYSYTVNGLIGEDILTTEPTFSVNTDRATVGEYVISATNAVASDNYEIFYVDGKLTVTNHIYGDFQNYNDDSHKKECACGSVIYEDHNLNDGKIIKDATCSEEGQTTYTCSVCAGIINKIINVTEHVDEDNNGNCDNCSVKISEIKDNEESSESSKSPESTETDAPNKRSGGCNSSASISALLVVGIASTAIAFKKKKIEE